MNGWDRHTHEKTKWIQNRCIEQGWTVGVAESCTGGNLAACFTHLPGSSHYFLGGVVAYSNEMKTKLLGVNNEVLALHGAVSEPVVRQMAQGALDLIGCDYSLAVSGIAGPGGGTSDKPVGMVWAAIGIRGQESIVWNLALSGRRDEVIGKAVGSLMERFEEILKYSCPN